MERTNTLDGLKAIFDGPEAPVLEMPEDPHGQPNGHPHGTNLQLLPGSSPDPADPVSIPLMELQQGKALQNQLGEPMSQLDGLKFDEILELFDADVDMPDFVSDGLMGPEQQWQQPQEGQSPDNSCTDASAEWQQQQIQILGSLTIDLDILRGVDSPTQGTPLSPPAPGGLLFDANTTSSQPMDMALAHLPSSDAGAALSAGEQVSTFSDMPQAGGAMPGIAESKHLEHGAVAGARATDDGGSEWGEAIPRDGEAPAADRTLDFMKDALYESDKKKAEDEHIAQELEERLGVKIPRTNVVTEFCDKHGRKALEETIQKIESEAESSGASGVKEGLGVQVSKKSIFGRVASALGLGRSGKPAVTKPKGASRVRPKDQLNALEQSLEALKKEEIDLHKELKLKHAVVDRMDSILNMKEEEMQEIKLNNVSLDSQLQEIVQRQLIGQLSGLNLEQRAKATSIPSIMMGPAPDDSPIVEGMVQNWKYSVERLTQILNEASMAGKTTAPETVKSIQLFINNMLNFVISTFSSTAGGGIISLIRRGLLPSGEPELVMEKYRRINSTVKFSNSQMKKLLALNKIFSSKIRELAVARDTNADLLKSAFELEHVPFIDRAREIQRNEGLIQGLRLQYLSMIEIRLLYNFTVFKKVLTPWQAGMCMMICYPMMPDPNFLSCAILNVRDLDDIPWSKYKELILAD